MGGGLIKADSSAATSSLWFSGRFAFGTRRKSFSACSSRRGSATVRACLRLLPRPPRRHQVATLGLDVHPARALLLEPFPRVEHVVTKNVTNQLALLLRCQGLGIFTQRKC